MTVVSLSGIRHSYGDGPEVLGGIDLEVASGDLCFLLGPSGCGKTTLLRIVAGFLQPSAGTVAFDGQDVTGLVPEKRGIGMVFQNYALWPHLDVAANVAFGLQMAKQDKATITAKVATMLELVGLAGFGERAVGDLSGGQQQRVALARALVVEPRVLLLDEPLSNLDAGLRLEMRDEIRRICRGAGVTALYVTHDQQEAMAIADRIAVLDAGRLLQHDSPRACYRRPRSRRVATFMGQAQVLRGEVLAPGLIGTSLARFRVADQSACGEEQVGRDLQVCLRPEDIQLFPAEAEGADEDNFFTAEIVHEAYLGDRSAWTLRVDEGEFQVHEFAPQERVLGSRVRCRVPPDRVILVPRDTQEA